MLRWIVGISQRFSLIVLAVAVAIMAVGATQLREAKVDVLPEFSPTVVQVQTEALGLSSAEVERMVTTPIEKDMFAGIAFVDELRSESISSLSTIDLVFEPGTDVMDARQLVQERLALATGLPRVSRTPEMLQPLSSSNRVLIAELSSVSLSQIELSVLARWRIAPGLLGVPGVANVAVWANRDRQLQVQVDPARLEANDVTLQQVLETTANALWFSPLTFVEASTPGTGGFIDGPNQRLSVRHVLPIRTAEDLAAVVIEGTGDRTLQLGDVAEVVEEHQPLIGDAITSGGDPGLALVVEKLPGASAVEVTEGVEAALAEMSLGLPGVDVDTTAFRPTSFIESALDNLALVLLLIGLLLVVVVALAFVDWRAALITLVSIVLAVLLAAWILQLLGATFNAVLLAGLAMALVIVIDEAVVGVHSAMRHRREEADDAASSLATAALAVRGPLMLATVIIAATAVPLLLLGGVSGAFYRELGIAYLVAVAAALVMALTVAPAMGALLLSRTPSRGESPLIRLLRRGYDAALARVVGRPLAAHAAVALVIIAGLAVLPALGSSTLLPPLKDRDLLVEWAAAPGTSHPEMMRITTNAVDELRDVPGVRRVGAHVGRAVTSDQSSEIDTGQIWLRIDEAADYGATTDAIREVIGGYPGIRAEVRTYPEQLIAATEPTTDDLVVRVYGDDFEVMSAKAEEVREAIAEVAGVSAPRIEPVEQAPTIQVEVDLAAAERNGVKPGDVRRAAATLAQGLMVGNLFEEQKVFDVIVWGVPELRSSVPDIGDLQVDKPDGGRVRLGDVADVRVAPNPTVLRHEGTLRYVDVTADISGRGWGAVADDVGARLLEIDFPLEHYAAVVDRSEPGSVGRTQLIGYGLAAAVVVFLLLQAGFASWRLTAVLFWVLPAVAAGGLVGAALGGGAVTIGTVAGLLAAIGIAARWLVLQVRYTARLEDESGLRGADLVVRAAGERLAPIAVTVVAALAVLLPLLFMGTVPGLEVLRPMAATLLGGLVAAAALILFVVPALCARYGASHLDVGLEPHGRQIKGQIEGEPSDA
jgi:Cu/Ag efflux pump CusA